MSQFTPSTTTIEPALPPDYLAGAVLEGLSRPLGGRRAWGLARSVILGLISFGFVPVIVWSRKLRQTATAEQQQYVHFAQWMRANSNNPEVAVLQRDAQRIGAWSLFRLFSLAFALISLVAMVNLLRFQTNWGDALMRGTYHFPRFDSVRYRSTLLAQLFNVWNVGLFVAYVSHWIALQSYAGRVRRFYRRFNRIAAAEGIDIVAPPYFDTGIRIPWLIAGIAMAAGGHAFWAIPMALAGALQRRYVLASSTRVRAALAHRLRAMMMRRRPEMQVAMPVWLRNLCPNSVCRKALRDGTNYCPRCGARAPKALNRVA